MTKATLCEIECEGCGNSAAIKRRSNGKKLLYLHCKNCGLDQRSGAQLQNKWQNAIDGGGSSPVTDVENNVKYKEWQPEEASENDKTSENDSGTSSKRNGIKWGVGIGLAIFAAIFGTRA